MPEGGQLYLEFDRFGRLWIAQFVGAPPPPGEQPPPGELSFWRVDDVSNYSLTFVSTVPSPAVSGVTITRLSVLEVPGTSSSGRIVLMSLLAAAGLLLVGLRR